MISVDAMINWWQDDVIWFLCNPTVVISLFVVFAVLTLFFICRYEYKEFGQMFIYTGIMEMFLSFLVSAGIMMIIYMLPLCMAVVAGMLVIFGLGLVFERVVIISVKGIKR